MKLEDKIKEYLFINYSNKSISIVEKRDILARDITKMCEDHVTNNLIYVHNLEKENKELKEQIKYLDGATMLDEDLVKENHTQAITIRQLKQQLTEIIKIIGIIGEK